jgi:formate dehydrogenase accessory protein FdhD
VVRWDRGSRTEREDLVAEEAPVTIVYNDIPHVVMMATPTNLIDFTLGFSITEGLIRSPADMLALACVPHERGMEMQATVAPECLEIINGRTRRLSGRTGCGVCGSDSVDAVLRPVSEVPEGQAVPGTMIHRALDGLVAQQELNARLVRCMRRMGSVRWRGGPGARGCWTAQRADKLIGAVLTRGINPQSGFVG